ncbi:MAG TPA: hypothetical protein VN300_04000 [Desulfobacterales bacterium]|nr:hypothetical protein [Desulfobacterales bacterium]
MNKKDRDIDVFSLSFLDCICCGFGAMILLFVLSKFSAPQQIEASKVDFKARIERLTEELHEIRGETDILNRELTAKREQLSQEKRRLARLQGDISAIEGRFAASKGDAEVQNIIDGQLARALQELTEEQKRLQRLQPRRRADGQVGGIPVDSEYIIFVIDTSNSMQRGAWPLVQKKLQETLEVYPEVKGMQVMNDDGIYMFSQYEGKWIPDTAGRRRVILATLGSWQPFSNSSPVEGIIEAIRGYHAADKRISLYVFGDEFSGAAIQPVLDEVDRMNRSTGGAERRVRIHAVGFPTVIERTQQPGNTGQRFATLMRALCYRNGGTFVGLNSTGP